VTGPKAKKKKKGKNFYQEKAAALAAGKVGKKVTEKKEREPAEPFGDDEIGVVKVNGINVRQVKGTMPTWVQEGYRWHINLKGADREGVYHVSREGSPMVHYSFSGTGDDIESVTPSGRERGSRSIKKDADGEDVHTKLSFKDLPSAVQEFVKGYWNEILG